MSAQSRTIEEEQAKADELLAELDLPPEISSVRAELAEDSSGETALWVVLHLAPNAVKARSDIKKITDFAGDVQVRLLHSGISAFPYIKLEEAA